VCLYLASLRGRLFLPENVVKELERSFSHDSIYGKETSVESTVTVPPVSVRPQCKYRGLTGCRVPVSQETEARRLIQEMKLLERPGLPVFEVFVRQWLPKVFIKFLLELDGGQQSLTTSASLQLLYSVFTFLKSGGSVFKIRPDLIRSLRDTDIPSLPVELLRAPFEGLQIQVPKGTFAEPAEQLQNIFVGDIPGDRFRVVFVFGEYTNYVNLMTNGQETIKNAMARTRRKSHDEMPAELLQAVKEESMYEDYYSADVFRFAVNCMLYVTCPDADMYQDKTRQHELHQRLQGLKGGQRRDTLLRKLAQERERKIYIVGANIRLSQEYAADLTKSGKSWILKHRCRVRGHWRLQPYGPKNSLRRQKWIRPFFKGPTYAEMVEKGYVVS